MKSKNVVFLSHIMSGQTPLYGGERSIILEQTRFINKGDSCNAMRWSFPNHAGTHVEAPLHFIEQGFSIADFEPENWIFNRIVLVEIPGIDPGRMIKAQDMDNVEDCELLLIKTGFEQYRAEQIYWKNSPGLHSELAYWLKEKCPSIRAIGIDFVSISNLNNRELGREAHRAFLGNNILLIEDMKLSVLERVPKMIIVAPLLVEKADGAPCTVFGVFNG